MNIGDGISEFTFDIYRILSNSNGDDNMFLSPYSVSAALMLTMLGCSGESESQLRRGLCLGELTSANVHEEYREMHNSLVQRSGEKVTLFIANRIFALLGLQMLENYKSDALKYYESETELLDFVGDSEGSRQQINAWVEEQTNNKIKDLIPSCAFDPPSEVVLVLINAIYFRGEWERKFEPFRTEKQPFFLTESKSELVDMMQMMDEKWLMGTSDKWDCKMLQLPYKGKEISMMIVLPNAIDGLGKVEASLSLGMLKEMRSQMYKQNVDILELPKFKIESSFELEKVLPQIGITDIFSPGKANFDRMITNPSDNIAVSKVIHKAFVEVKEGGTEAAAASVAEITLKCCNLQAIYFIANHPFLFLIQENHTGTILFIGRFTTPPPCMESQQEQTSAFSTTNHSSSSFSKIRKAFCRVRKAFSNLRK